MSIDYVYRRSRWKALFGTVDGLGGLANRPRAGVPDLTQVESILVVKLDQVGDLLLTLPLLRALRRAAPGARVELAVGRGRRPVLDGLGVADAIHELPVRLRAGEGSTRLDLTAFHRDLRSLRSRKPEVTIAAKEEPVTLLATGRIGSRIRIGFREGGLGFLLTHFIPVGASDARHQWEILAALAGPGGTDVGPPVFPLSETARERGRDLATELRGGSSLPLVVVHPGSGVPHRRWPRSRFLEVVGSVAEQAPALFVFVTGPGEPASTEGKERLPGGSRRIVLDRVLPLDELAALLERSVLLLGNESAPCHLAAAVGTPSVVPFLSGSDPHRWGPAGPRSQVVVGPLGVGPDPDEVARAALEILGTR